MIASLKQELDTLLNKEMDRKSFIKHIAFAIVMLTGVSAFAKLVSTMNKSSIDIASISAQTTGRRGYGSVGGYGQRLESDS